MIRRAIVRPLAVEDVVDAAVWYEAQSPGLGRHRRNVDDCGRVTVSWFRTPRTALDHCGTPSGVYHCVG
jgi:hypothetical protein